MRLTNLPLAAAALLIVALAPAGAGSGALPANPVLNGDFELAPIPASVSDTLRGTPLNSCTGIGHQVLYGSGSWQYKALDTGNVPFNQRAAAAQIVNNPSYEAQFFAGYGHCVWGANTGYDVVWFNPALQASKPVGWSGVGAAGFVTPDAFGAVAGYDFDNDPFDREVLIRPGVGSGHNMWQVLVTPFHAFTPNFDQLRFTIERGPVAPGAGVVLSLSTSPLETQHPYVGIFVECSLRFPAAALQPDADGVVRVSPLEGQFSSVYVDCDDAKVAWDAGDDNAKRAVLGRLRMVQLSFWNFNSGTAEIVIDDVGIDGATTVAEELARANVNPHPGSV